ncbi:MAG: HigA family addiction module antidote protein [Magnetococcales bacterium]|nr:HigA family addiction module antidote protein [Magnetococcales bacterium]
MSKLPKTNNKPLVQLPLTHPGEVLAEEMTTLSLSANALARDLDVPPNRISEILKGRRAVTADTALRLARYFKTSAKFWMNLQTNHDLAQAEQENGLKIKERVRVPS